MQEHAPMRETEVGEVIHYWTDLHVAGVHLDAPLDVGDHIHILGHTSDFEQNVGSMQIEHETVRHAEPGADVGIRVAEHAREHDKVYKVVELEDIGAEQNEL
ncbi:MAG: hypothetical protein QMC79_08190 [Anaerosomatales bacterium]|nr:hypothetical protein [Anaerosomatales bacterium]